jgi:hypothetical protein
LGDLDMVRWGGERLLQLFGDQRRVIIDQQMSQDRSRCLKQTTATLRRRGAAVLDYLTQAVDAYRQGLPAPALPSAT